MTPEKAEKELTLDYRLLKALSHPLRAELLRSLHGRVASPSQLATELEESLGNVSYHMKILEKYGAIELVKTEPARGALEHFYRPTVRPFLDDEHWSSLPQSIRTALFDEVLQHIWLQLVAAAEQGGLDDEHMHISWTPLDLDDDGYRDVVDLLASTLERAMEIHAESTDRIAKLDADERETRRTGIAILHFDRPETPAEPEK